MIGKLLTEHHLEFLSSIEGCTGSSDSTLAKMPHSWKSHAPTHITSYPASIWCRTTIGPPVNHNLNGVSLAGQWWSAFSCLLGNVLDKKYN